MAAVGVDVGGIRKENTFKMQLHDILAQIDLSSLRNVSITSGPFKRGAPGRCRVLGGFLDICRNRAPVCRQFADS